MAALLTFYARGRVHAGSAGEKLAAELDPALVRHRNLPALTDSGDTIRDTLVDLDRRTLMLLADLL